MTIQLCSLTSYYQNYWADEIQEEHWPVSFQPSERLNAGKNPSHPGILFSPLHGIMEVWCPSKKRAVVDRFCDRLKKSQCTGAQLAIDYLHEKYSQNLAAATIASAGGTILSFLSFLAESEVDISQVSKQIIGGYIERDQDNGLKTGAIRTKLRALYTFIGFLVDRKILPYEILHKKIRIKPEDLLPKAIPAQDIKSILGVIETTRDKALILLLLRTGMRIGELLNVVVSDIQLPERKILLYLGEKNYEGRIVYYSEDAEKALKDWLDIRDTNRRYLIYSRTRQNMSYVTAWAVFKQAIEAAGLSGKGYSLHSLRHTFATDMLNAGLRLEVLQQLLGHRSIEITRRYARMSDTTREVEYFRAMATIEKGGTHEPHRINSELQKVFEEKKLVGTYGKKLSS
ncbi:MAG TPA: site-specific integrase [Bacteroidales bacterium]|nr:site-specific integrase [Bacteroidales bacterium]